VNAATEDFAPSDLRVSDTDRDRAISELSEHFEAGRLTQDEFDERSGRALRARTEGDLAALFRDLPRKQAPATAPPPSPAVPRPFDIGHFDRGLGLGRRLPVVGAVAVVALVAIVASGLNSHTHFSLAGGVPVLLVIALICRKMIGRRR
jgi:Domain of unknown function (DUF1707)